MTEQTAVKHVTVTKEDLTFPVNYNDGTAVDPPAKAVFSTQAQITQFLAARGATNFKHLAACWDALPDEIHHDITFNLAAGVHRPRPTDPGFGAFNFRDKRFLASKSVAGVCQVFINGAGPSSYTTLVTSQPITGLSSDPTDPWMDFAGTPFAGMDLRGYFAVLNTGQVIIVHKHTSSRLYVIDVPSPTPISCVVSKPSTILRNSLNDIAYVKAQACITTNIPSDINAEPYLNFNDLRIEPFGALWGFHCSGGGSPSPVRSLIDLANEFNEFGVNPAQTRCVQIFPFGGGLASAVFFGVSFSIRGPALASPPQAVGPAYNTIYSASAFVMLMSSYMGGCASIYMTMIAAYFNSNTVHDQMPYYAIVLLNNSEYGNQDLFFTGQGTVFRNCGALGYPAMRFDNGSYMRADGRGLQILFESNTGPCILLGSQVSLYNSFDPPVFKNGPVGGNLDVGIQVDGPVAYLSLAPTSDVSGALGAVRLDGEIWSYTNIKTLGPVKDGLGNVVRKDV